MDSRWRRSIKQQYLRAAVESKQGTMGGETCPNRKDFSREIASAVGRAAIAKSTTASSPILQNRRAIWIHLEGNARRDFGAANIKCRHKRPLQRQCCQL